MSQKSLKKRDPQAFRKHTSKKHKNVQKNIKQVTQNEVPKSDFFDVFKGLGPRVPQGGPKDPPRALKVSPKVPKWSPQAIKNWQKIDKKQVREFVLKTIGLGGKP